MTSGAPPSPDRHGDGTKGTGSDVFISYGSDDVALARELRRHLEAGGYSCWMAPDDVSGPKSWAEQIVESIGSCKVMLVVISLASNNSTHVSKEVDLALDHGKAVLPVRVEEVVPSGALKYLLALAQWIDVFPDGVGPHADEVRRRVGAIVDVPSSSPRPEEAFAATEEQPPVPLQPPPEPEAEAAFHAPDPTSQSNQDETLRMAPVAASWTLDAGDGRGPPPPQRDGGGQSRWRWIAIVLGLAVIVLVAGLATGLVGGSGGSINAVPATTRGTALPGDSTSAEPTTITTVFDPNDECFRFPLDREAAEIRFEKGAISGAVEGTVAAGGAAQYRLTAGAGQTMEATVDGTFLVCMQAADGFIVADIGQVSATLPASQQYFITLVAIEQSGPYRMQIVIP